VDPQSEQRSTAQTSSRPAKNLPHERRVEAQRGQRDESGFISIANAGADIAGTNFWSTEYARKGFCFLSSNAGTLRLLVPQAAETYLREISTAQKVTIQKSIFLDDAWDIVFEDGTESPFCISMLSRMMDRKLQRGRCTLAVWTTSGKFAEFDCTNRV